MTHILSRRTFGQLLLTLALLPACTTRQPSASAATAAPDTVVYVVRHAEKDLTPGLADPPLTPAGQQRALALRDTLRRASIAAIFSTNTGRTRATAEPLAAQQRQQIISYDAKQLPALATRIRREYRGRTVVVVGHSNTILETTEALGARRPLATVNDSEYSYLLEVRLPADTTRAAEVSVRQYGAQ